MFLNEIKKNNIVFKKSFIDSFLDRTSIFDVVLIAYIFKPKLFKYEICNVEIILDGEGYQS